jgi:two-component system response regulator VicR
MGLRKNRVNLEEERPLTTGDVAMHCYVSNAAVLKWIKSGKLKAYRTPGRHYRIRRADFNTFLDTHGMPK